MAQLVKGIWKNVELKAHIETNESLAPESHITIETPDGFKAKARVIHRKAQAQSPMGKWRYLVQYAGTVD